MAEGGTLSAVDVEMHSTASEKDETVRNMELTGVKGGTAQNVNVVGINYGSVGSDATDLQNLEDKTLEDVSIWTDGLVRISAVDTVIEKLQTGINWITITGQAGEGKTTLGYMVLGLLKKDGHRVFKVDSPEDVSRVVRKRKTSVIMLNDVLGAFTFDSSGLKRWESVIHGILEDHEKSRDKKNQTRVLFISRRNVLEGARSHLGRYSDSLLGECHVVDLSKVATEQENVQILEYYLDKSGLSVPEDVKQRVTSTKSPHGFPHCCKIYVQLAVKEKDLDIEKYFASPLQFLDQTTKVLIQNKNYFTLFKAMLIQDGEIDIWSTGDEQRREELQSAATELRDSYLKESSGWVMFSHPSVYESVALSVAEKDQVFFLQHASVSLLMQTVNIQVTEQDKLVNFVNVHPRSTGFDILVERFRLQILDKDFSVFGNSRLCENTDFCEKLVHLSTRRTTISLSILKKNYKIAINTRGTDGDTMLNRAAENGNITAVGILIKYGADVNKADLDKDNAIHKACYQPGNCVVELLIKNGADVKKVNGCGETVLHILSIGDRPDTRVIELLIKNGADVNKVDKDGNTALHRLCWKDQPDVQVIELLIKNGVDVNKVDEDGDTVLHMLCWKYEPDARAFELLIKNGADLNKVDKEGDTALHKLCWRNLSDLCAIELLIKNGTDVNKVKKGGYTALHMLCIEDQPDIRVIELLIKNGADLNKVDGDGDTALHKLCWKNQTDTSVIELLIKNGADVNKVDTDGYTALVRSCCKDQPDIRVIELLIKNGADLNSADEDGDTVLHILCIRDQPDIRVIELLIKNGADLNKVDKYGHSVLHKLCLKDQPDTHVIELLIKNGAELNQVDKDDYTALDKLCCKDHPDTLVIELLMKNGADLNKVDIDRDTLLHILCIQNQPDSQIGADLNKVDTDGDPTLHNLCIGDQC